MGDDVLNHLYTLHEESEALLEEGDLSGALERAQEAHRYAIDHRSAVGDEALADVLHLLADIFLELDLAERALETCEQIESLDPDDEELCLVRGIALMALAQFDEAQEQISRCPTEGGRAHEALWHLGVLAEFRGEFDEAERLFGEANRIVPEEAKMPVRLGADQVHELLTCVIEELPEEVQDALNDVVIQIDPLPDVELLRESDPPLSPLLLGIYVGTPWGDKGVFDQAHGTDRILIFQRNIERCAHDMEMLHEQLLITLLHEIGHHLGWDEDDLADRGLD